MLAVVLLQSAGLPQEWEQGSGYRFRHLKVPPGGAPGFSVLPPQETGITFTNILPESEALTNTIACNGSGVAAGDVDEDGLCDLFFCGLNGNSRLYRNLGNWRFLDITAASGINGTHLDATGAVFADIDGDGHLDLLVNSIGGGTHLFFNDGKGHFKPDPHILNPGRGGTSLALADASGTGRLDLYIANYRAATIMDAPGTRFTMQMVNGKPEVAQIDGRPPTDPQWTNRFRFRAEMDEQGRGRLGREELGEPDVFYHNDGHGHFKEVLWTDGTFKNATGQPLASPPFDWGLSVLFRDLNGDGWPDLYVCNDFQSPDRLWLNDGHGAFRAAPPLTLREISFSSMGVDVADLNRDGLDEILVVDMLSRQHRRALTQRNSMYSAAAKADTTDSPPQFPRNMLFLNRGDGTYAEIAQYAGLDASEWSWAPVLLDVDLDGFEDVLVPNGFVRDNMNVDVQNRIKQATAGKRVRTVEDLTLRKMFPPLATPNLAFRNLGELRFEEVGAQWGFNAATISQGTCLADLDNDGDLDVIVNNLNAPAGIYRNNVGSPRIAVRLRGLPPNTHGIGARISVHGGPVPQSQQITCGGRYLSCDDTMRVFAAGSSTNQLRIEVVWRSGKTSVVPQAQPNCLYEIQEPENGEAEPRSAFAEKEQKSKPPAFFEDVSSRLRHTHHQQPFDDFAAQPLLPRRLSQAGPGVCWGDVNGDGFDDLIVAGGSGDHLACFTNDQHGVFTQEATAPWTTILNRDQNAVVSWAPGEILATTAIYQPSATNLPGVFHYKNGEKEPSPLAPASNSSIGPLALADYDGDGALDVFAGGRMLPGQYPKPASSLLYHSQNGSLTLDATNTQRLAGVGMVSGAVWSDLDGDGWPDLLLACEWGPLIIFHNQHGQLERWNPPVIIPAEHALNPQPSTLSDLTGWWNGVTTADLDGDGRMDIIASNWGRNTKYERWRKKPLRIYYGDFSQNGELQLLESYFDPESAKYVPNRMLERVTQALPYLAARFPTHQSWAEAGIDDVLGDSKDRVSHHEAAWLETTAFLNRGDHFEIHVLPMEAQLAPAFAVCAGDYDGDGNEDVFLSQNFFAVDSDTSPYDAGRGLWLQGDGHGGLRAVPGQESGVKVYGQQRGAALCDFDGDGRVDLVVTQNGGETRLFRNVNGKPGLRVRLKGLEGNPQGIGASLRLKFGDRFGPAREIHGGSGYCSQDSTVQVMAAPSQPTALWIRWPGGATATLPLPATAKEVLADIKEGLRAR